MRSRQTVTSNRKTALTPALLKLALALAMAAGQPIAASAAETPPRVVAFEGHMELDYTISVTATGLDQWAEHHDPKQLVPFIDGRPILGNTPVNIDRQRGRVMFHLRITPQSRAAWIDLLGAPEDLRRAVTFSIGPQDDSAFESRFDQNNPLSLTIISPAYGCIALAVVLLTLLTFVWLARTTGIIRKPAHARGHLAPYDLGRFQMAVWFFLIYVSYTSIWLITDATDTLNPSLLALLGISAGTALSEAMLDASAQPTPVATVDDRSGALIGERRDLERTLREPSGWPDEPAGAADLLARQQAARMRLQQINRELQAIQPIATPLVSKGFLADLLGDEHGYRFDRFQIFAFTLILGVIFVSAVYNGLTMPDLDPTLLGLMGLSSGTYIGFKFPERK